MWGVQWGARLVLEFSARGEFFPFYMELLEVCARSMAEKNQLFLICANF